MSPTYKNFTQKHIEFLGRSLFPGEELMSGVIEENLPYGIEKISDKPYYNNIIYSGCITKYEEIKIPSNSIRFNVHIYVEKGNPTIYFTSAENEPPLFLYEGAKWNIRYTDKLISKILVEPGKEGGKVWIIIERG